MDHCRLVEFALTPNYKFINFNSLSILAEMKTIFFNGARIFRAGVTAVTGWIKLHAVAESLKNFCVVGVYYKDLFLYGINDIIVTTL